MQGSPTKLVSPVTFLSQQIPGLLCLSSRQPKPKWLPSAVTTQAIVAFG